MATAEIVSQDSRASDRADVVAIHQPNFFPWLGYFNKIARAHAFCLLDDVQFPKKGGTWCNRVQLSLGGKADWVTMPVDRTYSGFRLIGEMRIRSGDPWREKLLRSLRTNYGAAKHFAEVAAFIEPLVLNPTDSVLEYNIHAIRAICAALDLDTSKLIQTSTLAVEGQATDLLVAIIKATGGATYLCGGGAGGYQQDDKFARAGIELVYQEFRHPVYPQAAGREFIPGLSIIDPLMHCGLKETARLVRLSC